MKGKPDPTLEHTPLLEHKNIFFCFKKIYQNSQNWNFRFPLQNLPLTKGSSSLRQSLEVINYFRWDRNWRRVERVASIKLVCQESQASDYPSGIDTLQKAKKTIRISLEKKKKMWSTSNFEKYNPFPKQTTLAWGSETQNDVKNRGGNLNRDQRKEFSGAR